MEIKFLSAEKSYNEKSINLSETYYGTYDDCVNFLTTSKTGVWVDEKGFIQNVRLVQESGAIWNVVISYGIEIDDSGSSSDPNNSTGPKSQRLSARTLSMPLEHHKDYRTHWNHYMIGLGDCAFTLPIWYLDANTTIITGEDLKDYRWIKSISELPIEADPSGKRWGVAAEPTKKGVENYDLHVFTISESAKFTSKNKAGQAAGKINGIFNKPTLGDFGIGGSDWKLDSCEIYHDGKNWIGEQTFTQAGDEDGWDKELYKKENGTPW